MTRALLITNPVAARTDARAVGAVRETLRVGGWQVDVLATHGAGDARRLAAHARDEAFDVVVSYGGDGTAMQIAAGLLGSGIPLGLVAGGTGNLLLNNLGLPRGPVAAARAMLRGAPRAVDLGAVDRPDGTHYFAVACGAGFDAEVMARTAATAKQRWKISAYVAQAVGMLRTVTNAPHRVTIDGQGHEVRAATVLIANCGVLVPPVVRLAGVRPDDGWFDVVALQAHGATESVRAMVDLVTRPRGSRRAWRARGRTVEVALVDGPARPVQMDGEAAGTTPFATRLVPAGLLVLGTTKGRSSR